MNVSAAVAAMDNRIFRPGWRISASPVWSQEGHVEIRVVVDTVDTNRQYAREGYTHPKTLEHEEIVDVRELDEDGLDYAFLKITAKFHEHEDREFLRRRDTLYAPFHPHRFDGTMRWQIQEMDLGGDSELRERLAELTRMESR